MRSLPVRTIPVRSHTCATSRARSPTPSSRTSPSSRVPSLPCPSSRIPSRTSPSSRVPSRTSPSSPSRVSSCTRSTARVLCIRLWLPTYTSRVRYSRMRGGADVDVRVSGQHAFDDGPSVRARVSKPTTNASLGSGGACTVGWLSGWIALGSGVDGAAGGIATDAGACTMGSG
ncbi:unnamed protein product [Closterium sp. NIES-65]|nr:unnamed protein product [Closterium sp. NIES-65]